jgi:hypothetical protein
VIGEQREFGVEIEFRGHGSGLPGWTPLRF